jgi:hypothetical protein
MILPFYYLDSVATVLMKFDQLPQDAGLAAGLRKDAGRKGLCPPGRDERKKESHISSSIRRRQAWNERPIDATANSAANRLRSKPQRRWLPPWQFASLPAANPPFRIRLFQYRTLSHRLELHFAGSADPD